MILYSDFDGGPFIIGPFRSSIIFRVHGSAIVKALIPAMFSCLILFASFQHRQFNISAPSDEKVRLVGHPYAIGALLAAFSFVIVFRANFGYARYWEACADIHQMLSKWTDMSTTLAAFHYQSSIYSKIRPPAFGQQESMHQGILLGRELHPCSPDSMREQLDDIKEEEGNGPGNGRFIGRIIMPIRRLANKTREGIKTMGRAGGTSQAEAVSGSQPRGHAYSRTSSTSRLHRIFSTPKLDGGVQENEQSLFLQEYAHLMSLMSAVAFSTLRGDVEGIEIPLLEYTVGMKWPPVDPDHDDAKIRQGYHSENRLVVNLRWLFGYSRNRTEQSLYDAARPFLVLGGVSDAEMHKLRNARGSSAKVALCSMWLQEFVTREYLGGSTGAVAPPIISRLYQYCSDGMIGYNQAKKIAYTPFPFPHAQVSTLFVVVVVVIMPVLMYSYVRYWWLAYLLNFFTVLCFVSLHMVARELEKPFTAVPNDLPLTTMQAEFNEALVSMFAGYNPDSWWEVQTRKDAKSIKEPTHELFEERKEQITSLHAPIDMGTCQELSFESVKIK